MKLKKLIRKALKKLIYLSGVLIVRDFFKYERIDLFQRIDGLSHIISPFLSSYIESEYDNLKFNEAVDCVYDGKLFYFNKYINWDGDEFPDDEIMSCTLDNSIYWSRCSLNVDKLGNDPKNIWELNRLEAVDVLVLHYLSSKEDESLLKAIKLFSSWESRHKYNRGINWFSNMEVALRLNRLILISVYVIESKKFARYKPMLSKMLEQHYNHLKLEVETTKKTMRGNHYLVELCTLTTIECLLGNLELVPILENEVLEQFSEDGSNIEGSTGYHIYTLESVLWFIMFAKAQKVSCEKIKERAVKAVEFINDLSINCVVPNIGDWDDGRVFKSKIGEPRNVSGFLSYASILLDIELYSLKPNEHLFKSNFGISRYRFTERELDLNLFFRSGNVEFGHTHLDMLSICLADQFGDWICDGGTGEYNVSIKERNEFRGVSYHSSIGFIDEKVLAPFRGFAWRGTLKASMNCISDYKIQGSYQTKLGDLIRRSVEVNNNKIIVEDDWPRGKITYNRLLVCAEVIESETNWVVLKRKGLNGIMKVEMLTPGIQLKINEKLISKEYGVYKSCNELLFNSNDQHDSSILQISFI